MRLLRVELTRAVWRRAVLLLLAAMLVVPLVISAFTLVEKEAPGGAAYDRAVAQAERDGASRGAQRELRRCVKDPQSYGIGARAGDDAQRACEEAILPHPEWYLYDTLDLASERDSGSGMAVCVVVALLAMLLGTTFVGHDWNTGSMSNQLLFEPRRGRVWLAKAVAVALLTLATAVLATTAHWLLLASRFWSTDTDLPAGVLLDSLQHGWRGAAVAAGAAVGGYALTMLTRSTVVTLGLLFGVAVAGGIIIAALVDNRGWVDPTLNAQAVINDGTTYEIEVPCEGPSSDGGFSCYETQERSAEQGVTYLAVLIGLGSAASVASYRRRDVP